MFKSGDIVYCVNTDVIIGVLNFTLYKKYLINEGKGLDLLYIKDDTNTMNYIVDKNAYKHFITQKEFRKLKLDKLKNGTNNTR